MLLCVISSGPSYTVFQLSWWYRDWFSGLSQWRSGTISFTLLRWLSLLLTVFSHAFSDKFSLKPKGKYFESLELSFCFLIVSSWSCRFLWSFLECQIYLLNSTSDLCSTWIFFVCYVWHIENSFKGGGTEPRALCMLLPPSHTPRSLGLESGSSWGNYTAYSVSFLLL